VETAEVYLGSSTVPAAVIIVVKYRACLLVGQLIVGIQVQSFSQQIVGIQAQLFVLLIGYRCLRRM
jgi:hypothetical protein